MIVNGRSRCAELVTIVNDRSEAVVEDHILYQSSMSSSSPSSGNLSPSGHGRLKASLSATSPETSPKAPPVNENTFNATFNATRGTKFVFYSMRRAFLNIAAT